MGLHKCATRCIACLEVWSLNVLMSFFLFVLRNNVFWFGFWSFSQERSRSRIIINWKKTKSKWQQILVLKKYQSPLILLVEYCLYSHFPRVILEFYKTAKKKKKTKILNYYNIGPGKLNDNNGAICMLQLLRCNLKPFCSN